MPTPTYTPLATQTLVSAAATVTFSTIPATYRDLVLVLAGAASTNVTLKARFNGDTGSNYTTVDAFGTGSAAQSGTSGTIGEINLTQNGAFGTTISTFITQIMDYSATDKHKTVLTRNNILTSSFPGVGMLAHRYASTAALTSILIFPSSGNFAIGSTFALYGIVA
jgi:hypothetical protein